MNKAALPKRVHSGSVTVRNKAVQDYSKWAGGPLPKKESGIGSTKAS